MDLAEFKMLIYGGQMLTQQLLAMANSIKYKASKGVVENLYVLRGLIDHSKYLEKCSGILFMTLRNVLTAYGLKTV